jgi:hypothetical protein
LVVPIDGVAFDVLATRRSVRRYLASGLVLLALALLLLGLSAWLWFGDRANRELQRNGIRSRATVVERSVRYTDRERQPVGSLTVDVGGVGGPKGVTIPVGGQVLTFHVGEEVTVVHRRGGSQYQLLGIVLDAHGIPLVVPVTFVVLLAGASFLASRHARLARRVTRSNRWVAVHARVVAVPYSAGLGQRSEQLLAIRGLDDRSILVQPVGMRRLNPDFAPLAWTAGVADRRFVVSPPGGGRVVCVQEIRPRRTRGRAPDPDGPPIA